jgi:hypothetical protein
LTGTATGAGTALRFQNDGENEFEDDLECGRAF